MQTTVHAQVHVGAVHVEDGGMWWVLERERYLDGLPMPRAVCGGASVAVVAGDGYSVQEDPVGTAIHWMDVPNLNWCSGWRRRRR